MRLVFLGTPEFALPSLRKLHALHAVGLVVTRPSRPTGRRQALVPPPVFVEAVALGLECIQPDKVNSAAAIERIRGAKPQALVAVAYGRVIGRELLTLAPLGVLNLHPSLLPRHRGASPVQAAILAGDAETGVSIMRMDEGLDTGPVLAQRRLPIGQTEMASDLAARLAIEGADLLAQALELLAKGPIPESPQDESQATVAKVLSRRDGEIDWREPAASIARLWRAMHPWPGAHTQAEGRTLKILECRPGPSSAPGATPGLPSVVDGMIFVTAGEGSLEVVQIQPEGRPPMSARDFISGYPALLKVPWGR